MAIELKHVACWEWSVMNVTSTHVIWTIGILTDFQINSLSTAAEFYRLIIINFRRAIPLQNALLRVKVMQCEHSINKEKTIPRYRIDKKKWQAEEIPNKSQA